MLDLGSAQPVASVEVWPSAAPAPTSTSGCPPDDPAGTTRPPLGSDRQWRVVAEQYGRGPDGDARPREQPVTTRFVLVYLTSLPKEGGRYRGGISEVEVRR